MSHLTSYYITIRPAVHGSIYHLDTHLATALLLLDTGADMTAVSHSLLRNLNLQPVSTGPGKTIYGKKVVTEYYKDFKLLLTADDNVIQHIILPEISCVKGTDYDFPVVIGMDVLSMCTFLLDGQSKHFTLTFP